MQYRNKKKKKKQKQKRKTVKVRPAPVPFEHLRHAVHRLTNHMQAIIGFMEIQKYDKALVAVREAINELRQLAKVLAGGLIIPIEAVVVVPEKPALAIMPPPKPKQ